MRGKGSWVNTEGEGAPGSTWCSAKGGGMPGSEIRGTGLCPASFILQPPLQAQEATAFDEAEIKTPEIITAPEGTYWKHF